MDIIGSLRLATVMDLLLDAVCVVDRQGRFVYVSAACERIFGYTPEELVARPMIELVLPDDRAKTLQAVDEIVAGHSKLNFENRYVRKDGRIVHILWSAHWSEADQVRVAVARDITERKLAEAQLVHAAQHDPLTELPNRGLFYDRVDHELRRARRDHTRLALLYLDLDQFKQVNDRHGHPLGDSLLQAVAQRLQAQVREADTVGRMGGDEFVVLLGGLQGPEQAAVVAEKIRLALCQPFELPGHRLCVSPSIGLALYPAHGTDCAQLIRRADKAMYGAKRAGGNRVEVASNNVAPGS